MGSSKPDNVEVEYLLGIIKEQLFDPDGFHLSSS